MENLIKIADLGVPLFLETPIYNYIYIYIISNRKKVRNHADSKTHQPINHDAFALERSSCNSYSAFPGSWVLMTPKLRVKAWPYVGSAVVWHEGGGEMK